VLGPVLGLESQVLGLGLGVQVLVNTTVFQFQLQLIETTLDGHDCLLFTAYGDIRF
jgi:hypothetical protein